VFFIFFGFTNLPFSQAEVFTFSFDPNDLVDQLPSSVAAGTNKNGPDSRVILGTTGNISTLATTYTNPTGFGSASTQPDGYNGYSNWVSSLGANEGLIGFNILLRGDLANVAAWGQQLKMAGDPVNNSAISGTAAGGWQVAVAQVGSLGYLVQWSTSDLSLALRPGGVDLPEFSFTADVVLDPDIAGSGLDNPVVINNTYDVWFGATNGPGNYALVYDALGWGSLPSSVNPFAAGDSTQWNGKLALVAVPEPSSLFLGITGLLILAGIRRARGLIAA
jgi:hypothetical protein